MVCRGPVQNKTQNWHDHLQPWYWGQHTHNLSAAGAAGVGAIDKHMRHMFGWNSLEQAFMPNADPEQRHSVELDTNVTDAWHPPKCSCEICFTVACSSHIM